MNDTKVLNVKIYFGVEPILRYYSIFEGLLENNVFDHINVSLERNILFEIRGELPDVEAFYNEYLIIMRWIFNNPNITVVEDESFELVHWNLLIDRYGQKERYYLNNDLIDESIGNHLSLPDQYITISTKIWGEKINERYHPNREKILRKLNLYKGKVLILGERNILPCTEYVKIPTISIYQDIIEKVDNYEDYTYEDSSENNDLEKLKKSFYILNKSSLNVFMTDSGMRITNLFLNRNIVGLTTFLHFSFDDVVDFDPEITHLTSDANAFIDHLHASIKKLNDS